MYHCRIIIIVFGFLFFLTIGCQSVKHSKKNEKIVYDFSPIKTRLESWVDKGYYPGASILITKNNQVVYEDYFGNYKPETVVYIASAGKWLAAATVAAVVEEGKLSWDDKVVKWLPEITDVKGQATLRQLFSHTSGYPDYQPKGNQRDDYQTLEESVKHIVSLPADTIAGAEFHYGGLAMQVAGRMAELATGRDFETIFQQKLAKPLGMKNTHFTPVDLDGGHSPMLGGGARCTLQDYAHFLEMIANEGVFKGMQILKKESVQEMQADQVKNALVQPGEYVENARALDHKSIYGLGEWREELDKNNVAVLISSPSWAGAYPWIDKNNNIYGFLLTHVNPEVANKDGFSSFLSSPIMATMTRDIILKDKNSKTGKFEIGDKELYYEMKGAGEPIVFLHGHSFNSSMWDEQFEYFSKKYKVIRYDLRGYGNSDEPDEGKEFLHAEDLNQLLIQLNIKKAHLVGLSLGSFVVGDFMALYPEKILSATLASGGVYNNPGPSVPISETEIEKRREEIALLKKNGIQKFKQNWLASLLKSSGDNGPSVKYDLWKNISQWSAWQPLNVEPRLLLGEDIKNRIIPNKIHFPVLFIYGEKDSKYSHNSSDALAKLLPNPKKVILKNCGHMSNMEIPEAFNNVIEEFLKLQIKSK
jgi:CubicO group peptidase (beta-lactamase class C family)/pimeloyl-ACP methyl ester carboxylesterase